MGLHRGIYKGLLGGILFLLPWAVVAADTSGTLIDWFASLLPSADAGKLKTSLFVILGVVGTFVLGYVGIYGLYRRSRAKPGDQEIPSSKMCWSGIFFGIVLIAATPFINMMGKTVGVDNAAQKASTGAVNFN